MNLLRARATQIGQTLLRRASPFLTLTVGWHYRCLPNAARASVASAGSTLSDGRGCNQTRVISRPSCNKDTALCYKQLITHRHFFPIFFFFIEDFLTNRLFYHHHLNYLDIFQSRLNSRCRLHGFPASCAAATEGNQLTEAIRSLIRAPSHASLPPLDIFILQKKGVMVACSDHCLPLFRPQF